MRLCCNCSSGIATPRHSSCSSAPARVRWRICSRAASSRWAAPKSRSSTRKPVTLRTRSRRAERAARTAAAPDAAKHRAATDSAAGQIRALEADNQKLAARIAAEAPHLQEHGRVAADEPQGPPAVDARGALRSCCNIWCWSKALIVWHIGPDSVFVRNVFLPRTEVMSKVRALQKSLGDREARFDETARAGAVPVSDSAGSQSDPQRSPGDYSARGPDVHPVPGLPGSVPTVGSWASGSRSRMLPSASVLLALRRSSGIADGKLLAVADPRSQQPVQRSKRSRNFSRPAARSYATCSHVRSMSKPGARNSMSSTSRFTASSNAAEPLLSYLSLAGGGDDDGKLTAAEMFGLPLDQNRLLVLSGCETGRAEATHGNEILGMVRALIYAGAGTWWSRTGRWIRPRPRCGCGPSTRQRDRGRCRRPRAQRSRAYKATPEYAHPYYWAAFTMMGR